MEDFGGNGCVIAVEVPKGHKWLTKAEREESNRKSVERYGKTRLYFARTRRLLRFSAEDLAPSRPIPPHLSLDAITERTTNRIARHKDLLFD